jgi:putative tricarboxylic transport membrane protein
MLLVLNLPLARAWAALLRIPAYAIYAGVLVFATLGTYAAGGTTADLLILCGLGLLGLLMRTGGIPVAPAVVGLILGPLAEEQLRRALTLSEGDPSILVSSPVTVVLWVVVAVALVAAAAAPLVRRWRT